MSEPNITAESNRTGNHDNIDNTEGMHNANDTRNTDFTDNIHNTPMLPVYIRILKTREGNHKSQ